MSSSPAAAEFTHSVTVFVQTFPPMSSEASEIESIFRAAKITFKQLRRSPVSITWLTNTDPSGTLDPHISDNLSCIESFQIFQLDADPAPASSTYKFHYSFFSIKIPSFSNCIVENQESQNKSAASPPKDFFRVAQFVPVHPPTSFRKALRNLSAYSKTSWGSRGSPLNAR